MACSIEHFSDQLIKSQTSLLNLQLQPPQLDILALDVLVELAIPAAHAHHHAIHFQVRLHDPRSKHVFAVFNHFDWHANIELLDQLSQTLVAGVALEGLVVDRLLEEVLGAR